MMTRPLMELAYSTQEQEQKRNRVAQRFEETSPNVQGERLTGLSISDLDLLFGLYKEEFFGGLWDQEVETSLAFSLSTRMTKSAGKTISKRKSRGLGSAEMTFEIRIGVNFFLQFDAVDRTKTVCGLPAPSALWALLLVFEHEICHVIESIYYQRSNCSKKRFKDLAYRLFGHMSSYHELPTTREIAYNQTGLQVGDQVAFLHQGHDQTGIVAAINKRATVMVQSADGSYIDEQGIRYHKFYVPLTNLSATKTGQR